MNDIFDFHTHCLEATGALISVDPRQFSPLPGRWYSVGFHPWHDVDALTDTDFELLESCACHEQVLAIGETGIDHARGAQPDIQQAVFSRHLQLARQLHLPVVVHNVRAAQDILACRRRAHLDDVPLAIHGMRGNEHVARTLLDAGCYLSYGLRFNAAALQATPLDHVLIETDDSAVSIREVASGIAQALGLPIDDVVSHTNANCCRLLQQAMPKR